jgi:hypothetical protein
MSTPVPSVACVAMVGIVYGECRKTAVTSSPPSPLLGFVDAEPARARLVLTQPHVEKRKGVRVAIDLGTSSPAPNVR